MQSWGVQLRAELGQVSRVSLSGQGLWEGLAEGTAWAKARRLEDLGRLCSAGAKIPAGERQTGCLGVQRPAHPPKLSLCHRYFENIPKGLDREGWTRGGIQPQKPGSRALNQPVTCTEAVPSPTESLRRLHPYVGR